MQTHHSQQASPLLEQFSGHLVRSSQGGGILDLACGYGRNGLYLARQGASVIFADRNRDALASVERALTDFELTTACQCWQVDFELATQSPLRGKSYDGIIVFNYLHRPLMAAIAAAIRPGGILIYQTFNHRQARLGKPSNPDFLLQDGELLRSFSGFEVLHHYEESDMQGHEQPAAYISQLVARKPHL